MCQPLGPALHRRTGLAARSLREPGVTEASERLGDAVGGEVAQPIDLGELHNPEGEGVSLAGVLRGAAAGGDVVAELGEVLGDGAAVSPRVPVGLRVDDALAA
ncbi:MAG: hypothetical protein AAF297_04450 [Planctomycetota bacterium]